jgi:broad specificity phosphatase PhoE
LAELLAPLGIRAIFATTVERTQQTAQPLADKLGLPLVLLPPTERATLMARLAALPASDAALVVGHADTLPLLLKDLGVKEAVAIGPRDYGKLFIVIPRPGSPPTLLRLAF